jgi:hypothetical protein
MADLRTGRPIDKWSITRHVGDVAVGDRVALWVAGRKSPGVYAIGRVADVPREDLVQGSGWRRKEDSGATMWFCPVAFDEVFLDNPIPRNILKSDRRFSRSRILTQPQAGNPFLVTDSEWEAIEQHAAKRRGGASEERSADNVWLEVRHRAQHWMKERTPVYTLKQNVENYVTAVADTSVERRSANRRGGKDTSVTRRDIERLWSALLDEGDTSREAVRVLYFAQALLQRAISGIGFEPDPFRLVFTDRAEAMRPFSPSAPDVPGLVAARRAGGRRGGGGGEGPVHAALKAMVKEDPVHTVGERLTYLSEDLSERLGDEVTFVTGDRVDLLMKDETGNYVVIEIEPVIGPGDHVGFHQAAKYWVLVAVAKEIGLDRVRRMVVATSIDRELRDRYERLYGIEWAEVPMPA